MGCNNRCYSGAVVDSASEMIGSAIVTTVPLPTLLLTEIFPL